MPTLSVRPLQAQYIPELVRYWCENTDEHFKRMGTDTTKLPSPIELANTLRALCDTPLEELKTYYLIWFLDDKPIGHNSLKDIVLNEIAHMHLHIWYDEYRGKGYGSKLFCMAALEFYNTFKLKMILCEPLSSNPSPNKMLIKIGFKKWKTYTSTSSELSTTAELNSYIIDANVARNFLNQSANKFF